MTSDAVPGGGNSKSRGTGGGEEREDPSEGTRSPTAWERGTGRSHSRAPRGLSKPAVEKNEADVFHC